MTKSSDEPIPVATIGRPFGVRGEVFLFLLTDRPLDVILDGEHRLADGRVLRLSGLRQRGGKWTCRIEGDGDPRALAASFTNAVIVRDARELPPRVDGEYSDFQIVGCRVEDTSGRTIGEVCRIERRYEVDTWIIAGDGGLEGEIPAVAEFVLSVDLDRRVIVVNRAGFNR